MRRTLLALATGAAMLSFAPTHANATHSCAPAFEILCWITCPNPPKICPHS